MRFKSIIAYDGTAYEGWQSQPSGPTVQDKVEEAINKITQEEVRIHGSGRTDAGVHARGQVMHFDSDTVIPLEQLHKGINAMLPADIRLSTLEDADPEFHARFDAIGKEYRYHIWNGPIVPPFISHYRTQVRMPLDLDQMKAAAELFVGEHDFASFSANANREVEDTVRRIDRLQIFNQEEDVAIVVAGNGFLYKMVRTIAGFLLLVGQGKITPDSFQELLEARQRNKDIPTAPAQGLFLWQVYY